MWSHIIYYPFGAQLKPGSISKRLNFKYVVDIMLWNIVFFQRILLQNLFLWFIFKILVHFCLATDNCFIYFQLIMVEKWIYIWSVKEDHFSSRSALINSIHCFPLYCCVANQLFIVFLIFCLTPFCINITLIWPDNCSYQLWIWLWLSCVVYVIDEICSFSTSYGQDYFCCFSTILLTS